MTRHAIQAELESERYAGESNESTDRFDATRKTATVTRSWPEAAG